MGEIQKAVGDFLLAWQTMIAGFVALFGAMITVWALNKQARDERARKSRAARALLPAALASVDDYALECVRWLRGASVAARRSDMEPQVLYSVELAPVPVLGVGTMEILRNCVEHVDAGPAKGLAKLMSEIQVEGSRLKGLDDYLRTYQNLDVKEVGQEKMVDRCIADAVEIMALSNAFFAFARMETNNAPAELNQRALEATFHSCGLEPNRNAGAYNAMTNRFLSGESFLSQVRRTIRAEGSLNNSAGDRS